MKVLPERKDWRHQKYRCLQRNLEKLQDRKDHKDSVRWFGVAESLQVNFHEDDFSFEPIRIHAEDVSRLIDRLEQVE